MDYKKYIDYLIDEIAIQYLFFNLEYDFCKSLILLFQEVLRGAYNSNKREDKNDDKFDEYKFKHKNKTGNARINDKTDLKSTRKQINRTLHEIYEIFQKRQENFIDSIDLVDEWRSFDIHRNKQQVLTNQRLSTLWKKQYNLQNTKCMKKFKTDEDRITDMTFNIHHKCISIHAFESMRRCVSNINYVLYIILFYKYLCID